MKITPAKILIVLSIVIMTFSMMTTAYAQGTIRADQKYIEAIKKSSSVTPVGVDSFGDNLDLSSGSVGFKWTDIDVPGNSSLPVRLQRSLTIEDKTLAGANFGGFGAGGNLDIPYLKGVFSSSGGWQVAGNSPNARCSMFGNPPDYSAILSSDYWSGNWMHIPWAGDQVMLSNPASVLPTLSGAAAITTKTFWAFKCLPSTQNGYPGEAFIAISPQGDKYYFDWVVTQPYSALSKRYGNYAHSTAILSRAQVYFLVTRIEDRFGNWVNYTYSGDKLQKITASDGRFIQIDSWNGNNIATVSSSIGSWSYAYGTNSMTTTQPDGSHWQYTSTGDLQVVPTPSLPVYTGGTPNCPAPEPSTGDYSLAVTQPSGATATYTFTVMRHDKSNVPRLCNVFINDQLTTYDYLTIPNFSDTLTLVSKTITGPGLPSMQWTYNYIDQGGPAFADVCANSPPPVVCPPTTTTEVVGPNGSYKRYIFGNMFDETSGQLMEVDEGYETGSSPNTQVVINKTATYDYVLDSDLTNEPFPGSVGFPGSHNFDDATMDLLRPLKQKQITLDGRTFTTSVMAFDVFGRPTQVTKSSAPSP